MSNFYDYYARSDTKEQMEALLVGAGLGSFIQINGITAFIENEGVVIDHLGMCVTYEGSNQTPNPQTFETVEIIKDPRWHTNIRTTKKLFDAQLVYLPLLPEPKNPMRRLL